MLPTCFPHSPHHFHTEVTTAKQNVVPNVAYTYALCMSSFPWQWEEVVCWYYSQSLRAHVKLWYVCVCVCVCVCALWKQNFLCFNIETVSLSVNTCLGTRTTISDWVGLFKDDYCKAWFWLNIVKHDSDYFDLDRLSWSRLLSTLIIAIECNVVGMHAVGCLLFMSFWSIHASQTEVESSLPNGHSLFLSSLSDLSLTHCYHSIYTYMLCSNWKPFSFQPVLHRAHATQSHSFHPLTFHSSIRLQTRSHSTNHLLIPQAHAIIALHE